MGAWNNATHISVDNNMALSFSATYGCLVSLLAAASGITI